jgi:predicted dehydrogenase
MNIGVIGIGKISAAYLSTLARLEGVRVTALADLDRDRAVAALANSPGARAVSVAELLAAEDIDLVLNLTIPAAHADVAAAALAAGKHVYGEKPLALDVAQARELLASSDGLRVGCAPDTVLGTGTQTARKLIDDGLIGTPVAANAAFVCPGHESWHPDPEFYYQPGGGPLLDMGPYYLSALVHLLGPIKRVTGATSRSRSSRTICSGARAGTTFGVDVETHVTGILEHASGALSTIVTSYDVVASAQPRIEIHGTEASISVPDPNYFDGDVAIQRPGDDDWSVVPVSAGFVGAARGIGAVELAESVQQGRPHRASAELALHVLDVSDTLLRAARERTALEVSTSCERPALVPPTSVAGYFGPRQP